MAENCGTILVVEDDQGCRSLVSSILRRAGYATVEAARGEEALPAVRRAQADLVLLDIQLPGLSGYEVCRDLRDEFGGDLPIVFISGKRTEPLDRVGGLLLGADDFVVKPFDEESLLASVRALLARPDTPAGTASEDDTSFDLTSRELDVLRLLSEGHAPKQIASELNIARKTVRTHMEHVLLKLGVHSQAQAVALALRTPLRHRLARTRT